MTDHSNSRSTMRSSGRWRECVCHNADTFTRQLRQEQCERCQVTKDWRTIKGGGASTKDSWPLAEQCLDMDFERAEG